MGKLALRLVAALLTFTIGSIVAKVWVIPHLQHLAQVPSSVPAKAVVNSERQKINRCPVTSKPRQKSAESVISKDKTSPWKVSDVEVAGREDLGVVQFLNANNGWVGGSKGALYRTADAGKTWQKVKLDVPPDGVVNSIFFVNHSVGWVVVSQEGNEFEDINTLTSRILHTADGGNSWETQYSGKAVRVDKVQFVNEQEGWAVGARLPRQVGFVGFILRTTDGGKHWADVSPVVGKDEVGNTSYVINILALEPSKAVILKFSGMFYSTEGGGRSWQPVASLPEGEPQEFLGEFKMLSGGRLLAVGGPDSIEGMWGTLARMDGDCSWTKYGIGGLRYTDAAVLSDEELIVSGAIIPSDTSERHYFAPRFRDGLIMHSSDGGSSWTVVYQNRGVPVIEALAVADSNNVWAVGKNGYLIHLQGRALSN